MSKLVRIFKGRNSPKVLNIKYDGILMDFLDLGVTKLGLVIGNREVDSDSNHISFSNGGKIVLRLGSLENPPYDAVVCRLIMYTEAYPLGFTLLSEYSESKLILHFA